MHWLGDQQLNCLGDMLPFMTALMHAFFSLANPALVKLLIEILLTGHFWRKISVPSFWFFFLLKLRITECAHSVFSAS